MDVKDADFGGYVTKAGLKCSDGRTITPEAFRDMDGQSVPLVWQHGHKEPENVLGHTLLEARDDGVYGHGFFNNTPAGQQAKALVEHKDIDSLSIFANGLAEKAKKVLHGVIREVSLVLSGANPGAKIDFIAVRHSDGEVEELDDEAIIFTGLSLEHSSDESEEDKDEETSEKDEDLEHAEDKKVSDVYNSFDDEQKKVVHYMVGQALTAAGSAQHSATGDVPDDSEEGLEHMNVFEKDGKEKKGEVHELSHDALQGIQEAAAKQYGGSLKAAFEGYALQHGIDNIDILFPDAKTLVNTPEWDKRRTEWVKDVINGTHHSPFSRVKTVVADITHEEARAKGYIKGTLKKEEFFGLSKRTTGPTTVYKKQKLDRDDMIDITDLDVVAWLKGEMRLMLEEEIARAILIGDGRPADHEDKIKDPAGSVDGLGIRSIVNDHELFATTVFAPRSNDALDIVEAVMRNRKFYKGSGNPTFYTSTEVVTEMLLTKDLQGKYRWASDAELAKSLRVDSIVEVEVFDQHDDPDFIGIIVNLRDYNIGADKGGEVSLFDDFDIDYNQYKYLIETRISGALTKIKSALVVKYAEVGADLVVPTAPEFEDGDVTIPNDANANYFINGVQKALGSVNAVPVGTTVEVTAQPVGGKYFASNAEDQWSFTNRP